MKLSRIDLIAQNGGDGAHYKYEEVIEEILDAIGQTAYDYGDGNLRNRLVKILVEAFPDEL